MALRQDKTSVSLSPTRSLQLLSWTRFYHDGELYQVALLSLLPERISTPTTSQTTRLQSMMWTAQSTKFLPRKLSAQQVLELEYGKSLPSSRCSSLALEEWPSKTRSTATVLFGQRSPLGENCCHPSMVRACPFLTVSAYLLISKIRLSLDWSR